MDIQLSFTLPHWLYWGGLLAFPLVYMWIAHRVEVEAGPEAHIVGTEDIAEQLTAETHLDLDHLVQGNIVTRFFDKMSDFTGVFVAYWTVIAVVVYFYEVIARYFFNSPTNWAHESVFLMFGMQYVLSGAYAYHHDAHVRVDLFYEKSSTENKAALDIITSFAFFTFSLALVWTSWTFFSSSMAQETIFFASGYNNEVSFTEWAVGYYPVKGALFIGSLLLLLQGVSRLIKDIEVFKRSGAETDHG